MWTVAIASAGSALSTALALALYLRDPGRSTSTVALAGACLAVGVNLLDDALLASGAYRAAPWALGLAYPALALIAPLVWLHLLALGDPQAASPARLRRHVGGGALVCLLLAPYLLASPAERLAIEGGDPDAIRAAPGPALAMAGFFLAALIQQGVYLFDAARRVLGLVDHRRRGAALAVLIAAVGAWLSVVSAMALELIGRGGGPGSDLGVFGLVLAVYALAVHAIARPPDPLEGPPIGPVAKYARSSLEPADLDRLDRRLDALTAANAIQRDPVLSLRKLARTLGVSPNDLSQLLNTRRGGFHAWLNAARIEDVKAMLVAPDRAGDSVADIAFTAGFNAKSTFYEAFQRQCGMTPARWRAEAAAYKPSKRAVER